MNAESKTIARAFNRLWNPIDRELEQQRDNDYAMDESGDCGHLIDEAIAKASNRKWMSLLCRTAPYFKISVGQLAKIVEDFYAISWESEVRGRGAEGLR